MVFYETTPVGRILQLFSSDLNITEIQIPWSMNIFVRMSNQVKWNFFKFVLMILCSNLLFQY